MATSLVLHGPHFSPRSSVQGWEVETVGLKAVGLAALPAAWTLPFVVVTADAFENWKKAPHSHYAESLISPVAFAPILPSPSQKFIVRSSASAEDSESRGWLESRVSDSTVEGILNAATEVWDDATAKIVEAGSTIRVALVVQQFQEPKLYGHLSNERRVSRSRSRWLCEIESPSSGVDPALLKFDASRETSEHSEPLTCANTEKLIRRLKRVAAWSMKTLRARCHYEWVWDGSRLWIVQRDIEREIPGSPPGTSTTPRLFSLAPPSLALFVEGTASRREWQKTESLRLFAQADVPAANLYVLEDPRTISELASGHASARLRSDLNALLASPIVFRTDILTSDSLPAFLSPRSETIVDLRAAIIWLVAKSSMIIDKGIPASNFCFIAHRYIEARAAAISLSRPENPRVRIDSIWGFPDGLLCFPHDSFEVIADKKNIVTRQVRCKPFYLAEESSGAWVREHCPAPWDWKSSLTDAEVIEIGKHSKRLAMYSNKPIELMFFVGVDPNTGYPPILPWIHIEEVTTAQQEPNAFHYAGKPYTITNVSDLTKLKASIMRERERQKVSIRLRPAPQLLRSKEFVDEVATAALELAIPVQLEGSILSHIYYMLARLGVRVRCGDPIVSGSYRQKFGKLVRDLIPVRIHSQGESAKTLRVPKDALIGLLKAKGLEEAFEVFWERDSIQSFEELADMLEVLVSSCKAHGRSFQELVDLAEKKRTERGGFEKGIVLVETDAVPLIRGETGELFGDSDPSSASTGTRHRGTTSLTSRRPRLKGRDLIIPMIPPTFDQSKTTILRLPETNQELEVSYSGKEITVEIRKVTHRNVDLDQLWLPLA